MWDDFLANHCSECELDCELRDNINFCENCINYIGCGIIVSCDAGHDIECNNGFEIKEN